MTRTQTLVLVGHGSQRHARSSAPLHAHAERIRATGWFDQVGVAFWKEEPALWDVRSIVETDVAYVVPVLTSEGYFADEVFPREISADVHPGIHYTAPVGTHGRMAQVIEARVESARRRSAEDVGVAVVGHGTERNDRSAAATERHARTLREGGRYAEVEALFLDEAPLVEDLYTHLDAPEIVVVPFFVADGYHTTRDIPDALDHPGVGESAWIDSRFVHYTGAVGTEPSLADVIVERAIEAGAEFDSTSEDLEPSPAGTAFVRWIDASASAREFGQLLVTRSDGGYALRHVADHDVPQDALSTIADPTALRERVRRDDRGRYRPLSGARTLPTGWSLSALGASALVRAVEFVYPASVSHWFHGRAGALDSTGFEETAARQTGLYADLAELTDSELRDATEAVCGTCVRDRRWGPDANTGSQESSIPCREACPFFLSAAHAFQESGSDAASEPDPDVPVGALEEPASAYRVRYARALAGQDPETSALPAGGDR